MSYGALLTINVLVFFAICILIKVIFGDSIGFGPTINIIFYDEEEDIEE